VAVTIKHRGDTAANWTAANPVLAAREIGLELDTQLFKVGDGVTPWAELGYWGQLPTHNHDGDYAAAGHTHDTAHNHDAEYAAASHTHNYATAGHTHDTAHNHDAEYAAASHTHNYAAAIHSHNYAAAIHSHNYNPLSDISLGTVVVRAGDLYIPSNIWTTIGFNGIHYQKTSWANWDGSTAIYPKKTGLYLLFASAGFVMFGSNGDNMALRFLRQGVDVGVYAQQRSTSNVNLQVALPVYLSVNQYVQVQALSCCGGSPYLTTNSPKFGMIYVGGHQ